MACGLPCLYDGLSLAIKTAAVIGGLAECSRVCFCETFHRRDVKTIRHLRQYIGMLCLLYPILLSYETQTHVYS